MLTRVLIGTVLLTLIVCISALALDAQDAKKQTDDSYVERIFAIRYGDTQEVAEEVKAQTREFIWESWRQRRTTHCVFSWSPLKNKIEVSHFYISQDTSGHWQVLIRVERNYFGGAVAVGREGKMETVAENIYNLIQRREVVPVEGRRLIGEDEKPKARTYELWFRNEDVRKEQVTGIGVL